MQRRLILALAIASLAACKPAPAPTDADGSASAPVETPAVAEPAPAAVAQGEFGETLLWLEPLATCDGKQVGKVHWSKEAVANGVAQIEAGEANPGDFARVGDAGEKETGTWAHPGLVMILRGEDGAVLARQVFKGPGQCQTKSG